jgi:N-acetylglucosaminyl-diphospho-decaprenol L-rhamnosyltransferase
VPAVQVYGTTVGVVSWGSGPPAPVAGTGPAVHVTQAAPGAPAPGGATPVLVTEALARAAAVNRGVVALPAEVGWVLAVDTGVTLAPGALDALLAAAVRFPRAAVLGPRLPGATAGPLPARRDLLAGRVPLGAPRSAGPVGWVSGRCVLLRRAAWDSVDGYDPRHLGPVDAVDLGDRLARAGWLAVHVPGAEAAVAPGPVPGMLETARDGLRRYAAERHRGLARLT